MNTFQKNGKEYRNGMHHAKNDRYECGEFYVKSQLTYGLQGRTDAFYKGYKDYYNRYCR